MQFITNSQLDAILKKYGELSNNRKTIANIYMNTFYVLCVLSLRLKSFLQEWHGYYDKFQILAKKYNEMVLQMFLKIENAQSLYLVLFQNHYSQSGGPLIQILFQNKKFFGEILNIPNFYNVLYQLWIGNNKYNNNFYLETYYS